MATNNAINLTASGVVVYNGSGTFAGRTLTAGSSKISIANGDGTAGNPTFDAVEANFTLNNIGGTLGETKGGTGQTTYTTGDILYASGANTLSKLTAGTNGQVLTLAAGVPSWAAAGSGSGGWTFLASATAAASATVEFIDVFSATYQNYVLVYDNVVAASTGGDLWVRFSTDSGGSWIATNYASSCQDKFYRDSGNNYSDGSRQTTTAFVLAHILDTSSTYPTSGVFWVMGPFDNTTIIQGYGQAIVGDNANTYGKSALGGGNYLSPVEADSLQIFNTAGNLTSGTFRLYGIANS